MKVAYKRSEHKAKGFGLRYWAIVIGVAFLMGFIAPERLYKFETTKEKWIRYNQFIDAAKYMLSRSDLPAKDVSAISDSLTLFQVELGKQLNPIFQKEQDSLNKVKPKPTN